MSHLTHLVKFVMDFQGFAPISRDKIDPRMLKTKDPSFNSLENFQCIGSARSLSVILHFMMEAPLSDINLNIPKISHPDWFEDMKTCMEAVGGLKSLKIVRIKKGSGGSDLDTDLALFRPLGHLKLQVLEITDFRLGPSDYEFRSLTAHHFKSGWRSLTRLHLACDGKEDPFFGNPLALAGLAYIVKSCPILEELKFFAAFLTIPPLPDDMQNHPLKRLIIGSRRGKWAIGDMVNTARYINRLFPRLDQLRGYAAQGPESDQASSWGHIEVILLSYQAVRSEAVKLGRESMLRDLERLKKRK